MGEATRSVSDDARAQAGLRLFARGVTCMQASTSHDIFKRDVSNDGGGDDYHDKTIDEASEKCNRRSADFRTINERTWPKSTNQTS